MTVDEEKKIRSIIKQGLKHQFSLSETDLIAPNLNAWDKIKEDFKNTVATLLQNLENDDYNDASGEISKAINMLKTWKHKIEKDINDSELNENLDAKYQKDNTYKYAVRSKYIIGSQGREDILYFKSPEEALSFVNQKPQSREYLG